MAEPTRAQKITFCDGTHFSLDYFQLFTAGMNSNGMDFIANFFF